jgi:hypothetical protein
MKFSTAPSAAMAGLLLTLGYISPAVAQVSISHDIVHRLELTTPLGQTFQRLGACPTLGCIFPPSQAEFIAGGHFDIRLEVSIKLHMLVIALASLISLS